MSVRGGVYPKRLALGVSAHWVYLGRGQGDTPPEMTTAAVGTHPTGMRSCFCFISGMYICVFNISALLRRTATLMSTVVQMLLSEPKTDKVTTQSTLI